MNEIRDKVREKLEDKLWEIYSWDWHTDPDQAMEDALDEILSIPELAVIDRETELPTYWMGEEMPYQLRNHLIEDGWVKEVKG